MHLLLEGLVTYLDATIHSLLLWGGFLGPFDGVLLGSLLVNVVRHIVLFGLHI